MIEQVISQALALTSLSIFVYFEVAMIICSFLNFGQKSMTVPFLILESEQIYKGFDRNSGNCTEDKFGSNIMSSNV